MLVKAKMFHTGGDCAACHPLAINYCSLLLRLSHVRKISMKETWCIWRSRNVKFPFRWSTKPRDQKQKTGNDCDVISGLKISRKTDFSDIFLFSYKQRTLYHFLANLLAHNNKLTEKSVFRETLSPEMASHLFPVSCFWSLGFVPHRKRNLTFWYVKTRVWGRKIALNIFLLYLSVHCGDFIEQTKKICDIHFKLESQVGAVVRVYCGPEWNVGSVE